MKEGTVMWLYIIAIVGQCLDLASGWLLHGVPGVAEGNPLYAALGIVGTTAFKLGILAGLVVAIRTLKKRGARVAAWIVALMTGLVGAAAGVWNLILWFRFT